MKNYPDFEKKIALVTGAGGKAGIGRGICIDLAKQGTTVVVSDLNLAGAEETAKLIIDSGGKAEALKLDVTSDESVEAAFEHIKKKYGRLDILVNNAAAPSKTIGKPTMWHRDMGEWDLAFSVDLKGLVRCCKYADAIMREQKSGRIINVASIGGKVSTATFPDYGAMKAGVLHFTKTLATELAPFGVTVNSINPGYLFTELWEKTAVLISDTIEGDQKPSSEQIFMSIVKGSTPMGVAQEVKDVAHATTFLCSDYARYITGHAMHIDGGACMY